MPDAPLPSAKLQLFGEVLAELLENRHKALVFSQFVDHLHIIRDYLEEQNIKYKYLDGSTPAVERKKRVDAFQAAEGDVFLISLKAISAIALLSFMVINPRVNAQTLPEVNIKPQIERMQVESDPNQNLNQDEQKVANYLTQGFSLFKAKNYPEAIKAFNEVIRIQPNNQYAYFGRGVSNYLLEKYQQAKTDLDKSIELDSSLPLAYFFRGITNSALGNKDNAITDLETAAKLFEKDGNTELAQTSRDVIKRIRNA